MPPLGSADSGTDIGTTTLFEAPTQLQSPYQAPLYPPPTPSTYTSPPYPYPTPPATYTPPAYGQVGYPPPAFFPEVGRLQSQARNSLILGLLGLLCCGLLGPIALGIGIQAKNGLQRLGVNDGQGIALAGAILGGVATAAWVLWLVVSLISK